MAVSDVYVELRATIADFQAKFSLAADQIAALEAAQVQAATRMEESSVTAGAAMQDEAASVDAAAAEMEAALARLELSVSAVGTGVQGSVAEMEAAYGLLSLSSAKTASQIETDSIAASLALDKEAATLQANVAKMQLANDKAIASNDAVAASMDAKGANATAAGNKVATAYLAAGAATAALGAVAVDMAAKYQTLTTRLVTSAGESQQNIKMVSDGMLTMAGQVGISADQLATGMYTVESAGYHASDALTVLKAAAQGAKDEGASLGTVADAVSTALKDYHLPADQAATVTSQLVDAVAHGKTNMEEFSGSLSAITPMASAMGISLADVTGSLAEMTSHGMSAQQASQDLAQALRSLQKPTGPMIQEFSQLQLSAQDVQKKLSTEGLAGTIDDLSRSILSKMGPSGQMLLTTFNQSKTAAASMTQEYAAMTPAMKKVADEFNNGTLSGKALTAAIKALPAEQGKLESQYITLAQKAEGFNSALTAGGPAAQSYTTALQSAMGTAPGFNAALMLTKENAGETAQNIKDIAGSTADAQGNVKGFADIQGTLNQKLDEAKAGFGALVISVGEKLLPAVSTVVGWLATAAQWLSKHQGLATALAIGIGVLAVGFTGLAAAMWLASLTPVTLIIAGIIAGVALLAGGIYLLISHWSDVTAFFSGLWDKVKKIFSDVVDWVVGIIKGWYPLILGVLTGGVLLLPALIFKYWGEITGFFSDLWHKVEGAFSAGVAAVTKAFGAIGSFFSGVWHDVENAFSVGVQAVLKFVTNLPQEIGYALGWIAGTMVRGALIIWDGFTHGLVTAYQATVKFFTDLPGNIARFFTSAGNWLVKTGSDILHGLATGIANTASAVWQWFQDLPGNMEHFFSDAGNWLLKNGQDLIAGIGRGFVAQWNAEKKFFTDLPGNIGKFFSSVGDWLYNAGRWLINGVWRGVVDEYNSMVQFFRDLPGNIGKWLGNAGDWLYNAGRDILFGLWNGIQSVMGWLGSQIKNFAGGIVSGFKGALGIQSPSRVMAQEIGQYIPAGIAQGITNGMGSMSDAAHAATQQALSSTRQALSGGLNATVGLSGELSAGTAGGMGGGQPVTVINVTVMGNAVTEKELAQTMQQVMTRLGQRNSQTYRNYKR